MIRNWTPFFSELVNFFFLLGYSPAAGSFDAPFPFCMTICQKPVSFFCVRFSCRFFPSPDCCEACAFCEGSFSLKRAIEFLFFFLAAFP